MRRKDWFPNADPELISWSQNFEQKLSGVAAALGISPAEVSAIQATGAALRADIMANNAAQKAAQSARAKKDATTAVAEGAYRASRLSTAKETHLQSTPSIFLREAYQSVCINLW